MKLSPITKEQWVSVVKNAIIAGVASLGAALQQSGDLNKATLTAAIVAAGAAIIKVVEKAFTEA